MKASHLVTILQRRIESDGDLEVRVALPDGDEPVAAVMKLKDEGSKVDYWLLVDADLAEEF